MNFHPLGIAPMSSDETPKIEPTLTDAPSIAPKTRTDDFKSEAAEKIAEPKAEASPEIKLEARAEPAKIEPGNEPKSEKADAPMLPPAPQIEPPKAVVLRRPH